MQEDKIKNCLMYSTERANISLYTFYFETNFTKRYIALGEYMKQNKQLSSPEVTFQSLSISTSMFELCLELLYKL